MTKSIPLTQGKFALVDDNDFDNVSQYKWSVSKYRYASALVNRQRVYLHRFIMNAEAGQYVDHIDGSGFNCQRVNMRLCTNQENLRNRGKQTNNTTGYKGVSFEKFTQKYAANIMVSGKTIKIGRFSTKEEAARAYDEKAKELFGDFGRLNF